MGHLFIGGGVTFESKTPTSKDVDVGAPAFCTGDLIFSDDFRDKLDADAIYDSVETLQKNGTLATDAAVSTSGDVDKSGHNKLTLPPHNHSGNQNFDSFDSEDEPESPDHHGPEKCHQCGAYIWIERDCTHWNVVYLPVDQADVSENSAKEDLEYLELDLYIGNFFDSVGGDETDEAGAEGVTDSGTKSKVEYHKEENTDVYLNFKARRWNFWGLCWTADQIQNLLSKIQKIQ